MILAGNILNIIAPVVQIISFGFKKRITVLCGVIAASAIWLVAFVLLGVPSAAVLAAVGIVLSVVNYLFERRQRTTPRWVCLVLLAAIVAISIAFYTDPVGLLPSAATALLVVSVLPKKQIIFRSTLLVMSLVWLVYGILSMQFGVIAGNSIQTAFLIFEMIVILVKARKHPATQGESIADANTAAANTDADTAVDTASDDAASDGAATDSNGAA